MANLEEITTTISQNFSVAEGIKFVKPLGLFVLGLAIYSWFIFKFYKHLARREIFDLNLGKKARSLGGLSGFFSFIFYIVKHIFIYPVILLFWVGVLSVILAFLARNTSLETIILISFSLVAVVRVMAHYDEDLSKDLAKMMPFALLGVFLVDVSYFSTSNTLSSLKEITTLWKSGVYYFIVLLLLEWVLKILYGFSRLFVKKKTASDDSEDE